MKHYLSHSLVAVAASVGLTSAQVPVLQRSDVVSMYQAPRQTYQDYGATVLAWGGTPTTKSLEEARGLKFFGSVGMVTEFARYHERFPDTYEQGLCRKVDGQPYKVPWLTDHQHKGVPYWWCCTRQPVFRQYISERVVETVKAGADGVHIDDHLGTAGGLYEGGCFCDRCVAEFRNYLGALPPEQLAATGVRNAATFDFRVTVRAWIAEQAGRKATAHPLFATFRVFQLRGAAAFMNELRALAAKTAGHPVPMSANACLTWGPHLNDFQALDFFSAEVEHHATAKRFNDDPLVAYRLADAVGRPLAATASGGDWAFIKEQNLPGLVQGWIALSYAAGHSLMTPHHQWCYTPEKGTHWYDGPKEKFAPLYQFVRQHRDLFDDCETHADLTLVLSFRTFDRDPRRVMDICGRLAAASLSFRIALGGDDIVNHPLAPADLRDGARLLVPEPKDFSAADQRVLAAAKPSVRFESLDRALAETTPAVRLAQTAPVRVFPRVKPGIAVVHLLNWDYDAIRDAVKPIGSLTLQLDLPALGLGQSVEARLFPPGAEPQTLRVENSRLVVPELGLWSVIELRDRSGRSVGVRKAADRALRLSGGAGL